MSFTQNDVVTIQSLPVMEKVVEQRMDLGWDGWNVLQFGERSSILNPKSRKVNGEWRKVERYPITESGWKIPSQFIV